MPWAEPECYGGGKSQEIESASVSTPSLLVVATGARRPLLKITSEQLGPVQKARQQIISVRNARTKCFYPDRLKYVTQGCHILKGEGPDMSPRNADSLALRAFLAKEPKIVTIGHSDQDVGGGYSLQLPYSCVSSFVVQVFNDLVGHDQIEGPIGMRNRRDGS